MKIFNDVRSRSPLGEVGQKPVDTPLLAAGSRAFERIVFIRNGLIPRRLRRDCVDECVYSQKSQC